MPSPSCPRNRQRCSRMSAAGVLDIQAERRLPAGLFLVTLRQEGGATRHQLTLTQERQTCQAERPLTRIRVDPSEGFAKPADPTLGH
ncbi:hypothetical protein EYF80_030853 [Liparis tanakae]|uniref:Uncharacterized protein n=1 Tax=Liparis tanakae TaxID=230148 RepID=A0A4Z2H0C9_9TELE|nr:hypothetical protein EYF80_030853 [Liparis tanakae]